MDLSPMIGAFRGLNTGKHGIGGGTMDGSNKSGGAGNKRNELFAMYYMNLTPVRGTKTISKEGELIEKGGIKVRINGVVFELFDKKKDTGISEFLKKLHMRPKFTSRFSNMLIISHIKKFAKLYV